MRLLAAVLFVVSAHPAAADSVAEFREAGSLAMQADMKAALPHLAAVQPKELSDAQRGIWSCMRERFAENKAPKLQESIEPFAGKVLRAYRDYWTQAMLGKQTATQAEASLAAALSKLLDHRSGKQASEEMNVLEPLLEKQLEQHGYHALFGVTAPLREFMAWRKQDDANYTVDLPEGVQAVHVVFMDDFISLGWLGYATCDYRHSGGWAETDKLFAVRSAYDLESESFRVSYLAHEGQHFSDYLRHPGLEQADLEYRAKLVEIARAQSTLYDLLDSFSTEGGDSREQAHPWANRQVATQLASKLLHGEAPTPQAWQRVPVEQLHAAALELLAADSRKRSASK